MQVRCNLLLHRVWKEQGFFTNLFSSCFFFYHPPWFADHWNRLPFSHKKNLVQTLMPLQRLWDMNFSVFNISSYRSHWKNLSMLSLLSCLLQNYGDLISYFASSTILGFTTMCLSEKHKGCLHVPKKLICSLLCPFRQWIKFWILLKWWSMYFPLFYSVNELFKKGMSNATFKILSPI